VKKPAINAQSLEMLEHLPMLKLDLRKSLPKVALLWRGQAV
jgi:hypothetical protein